MSSNSQTHRNRVKDSPLIDYGADPGLLAISLQVT